MNQLSKRLIEMRKKKNMTQNDVAEKLDVSFQSVSLWERGVTSPDITKLPEIADLFNVTLDWLLMGREDIPMMIDFEEPVSGRLFNEERMYTYINTYATVKGLHQTVKVLPYAKELHRGQFRKGQDKIPYIYHPLLIACHALALGLDEDDLISTALLHDVCEDCGVMPEELPVNETVKEAVALLTKNQLYYKNECAVEDYYEGIKGNPLAIIIKLLDRCNNISGMASGFTKDRMVEYINETEKIFYPMIQYAKHEYPQYANQLFLIKYHISSVIVTIKNMMSVE